MTQHTKTAHEPVAKPSELEPAVEKNDEPPAPEHEPDESEHEPEIEPPKQAPLTDCRVDLALVASFPAGFAAETAQRKATVAAAKAGTQRCDHKYVQHFGGEFSCADCWALFKDVAPDRIAEEQRWLDQAKAQDAAIQIEHAEFSFCLGVTAAWIIAFTDAHDCWTWTTRDVQAYIIKAATAHTRGRYIDLPHVRAAAGVGPADVMVSRGSALCSSLLLIALVASA
eukprot:SAG31_NODE_500_length_14835_cov_22.409338_4_plen_226_part_00